MNIQVKHAPILVVDDEPTNLKLVEKLLEKAGYTKLYTTNEPLEVLPLSQQWKIDLILLDLNMPKLNGFGVLAQLKEAYREDMPTVLALTAQADPASINRALSEGMMDYVTKPFDCTELLTRIRNLLKIRLQNKIIKKQNEVLELRVEERTQQLRSTQLEVVRKLGRAAEYRDNETGFHIIRMSKTAALLGRTMGLNDSACELILNASPMHDIGKIGIPDQILLKPGKLTPQEWEIMKTHTIIGADILSGSESELMRTARDIALSHHEHWDGSGYPYQLKGKEIPLTARITAIADVYDALRSDRPYKKSWPVEQALQWIKAQNGKKFDPQVAEAFLSVTHEINQIHEEFAEPTLEKLA